MYRCILLFVVMPTMNFYVYIGVLWMLNQHISTLYCIIVLALDLRKLKFMRIVCRQCLFKLVTQNDKIIMANIDIKVIPYPLARSFCNKRIQRCPTL